MDMVGEVYYKSSYGFTSEKSVLNASYGYFYLGIGMIVFSMIIGHKPSILYTRNRPEPLDMIWKKYPIWEHDNAKVVGGYLEPSVPLKKLNDSSRKNIFHGDMNLCSLTYMVHLIS